jgi:hypothetical protein
MTQESSKERNTDRILILKPIEGKAPISSTGLVDTRLFSGENKLHAIQDPTNLLWSFKYESGGLPNPLQQRFTNFTTLLDFATKYFKKRNVEIVEVID